MYDPSPYSTEIEKYVHGMMREQIPFRFVIKRLQYRYEISQWQALAEIFNWNMRMAASALDSFPKQNPPQWIIH